MDVCSIIDGFAIDNCIANSGNVNSGFALAQQTHHLPTSNMPRKVVAIRIMENYKHMSRLEVIIWITT